VTPLRTAGLAAALVFAALTIYAYRRGRIGNGDLLVRLGVFTLPLLIFSLEPGALQWTFDELSFRKGGGHQIMGATVLAVGVLYLFAFSLAGRGEKSRRDLTRLIENLALEQFRATGRPEQFAGGVAVVGFHSGLATARPEDAKNITAKVLVCIGAEDPLVPPEQRAAFEEEMRAGGVDWTMNLYGGAAHSFTNPNASALGIPGVEFHEPTDLRSWQAMRDLFSITIDT